MEFGSDFHKIEYPVGNGLPYGIFNHYVSGRQPLLDLIQTYGYRRIWIPTYYCGESTLILDRTEVEIKRYNCLPTDNPDSIIETLPLEREDLLLRTNYFGLHGFHKSNIYPCDVIEDHTHDLIGEWALNSNAKWCFASIRKTLPTADGGILWSPDKYSLPDQMSLTSEVASSMSLRYNAMVSKEEYLKNGKGCKDTFLKVFRETEECFGAFSLSDWLSTTSEITESLDLEAWYNLKKSNYFLLLKDLDFRYSKPITGSIGKSTPFSLIILYHSNARRENAKNYLIRNNVYPAILWPDVYGKDSDAVDFSRKMLSIHCDGRYSRKDIYILSQILNHVI